MWPPATKSYWLLSLFSIQLHRQTSCINVTCWCFPLSSTAPTAGVSATFLGKRQEFAVLSEASLTEAFRDTGCLGALGLLHEICQFGVFPPRPFQLSPESAVIWQLVFIVCGLRLWFFSSFTENEVLVPVLIILRSVEVGFREQSRGKNVFTSSFRISSWVSWT